MPARPLVTFLPDDVREELNQRLISSGFSGYVELSEWLEGKGFLISKSSIHRYGQEFQNRLEALKVTTEQAKAVAETLGDDENLVGDVLLRLASQKLFDALVDMNVSDYQTDMNDLMLAIARISQASVGQKRWQVKMRGQIEDKLKELEKAANQGKQTLDPATLKVIREQIFGLL